LATKFRPSGDEITFLEVNPNGKFGWLDEPGEWPLHRAVLEAVLDPTSAVQGDETVREALRRGILPRQNAVDWEDLRRTLPPSNHRGTM
jgi:hypothetical protein